MLRLTTNQQFQAARATGFGLAVALIQAAGVNNLISVILAAGSRMNKSFRKSNGLMFVFADQNLCRQSRSHHPLFNRLRGQRDQSKPFLLHIARADENPFDNFGRNPIQLAGAFFADPLPTLWLGLEATTGYLNHFAASRSNRVG
jgi:hypothetical protein